MLYACAVDDYRYGFNGQEKSDESKGDGNRYTAQFWEYDSRIGRRWNKDPKPDMSISHYAVLGNSPIWFADPFGDTLDVGNQDKSKADVLRIVSYENRKYVDFTANRVRLNTGISLENDKGAKLLSDLVMSDKKFLYEASDVLLIRNDNGDKVGGMTYLLPNRLANASKYGKDGNGGHEYRPKAGYDGHVVIHPDAVFIEYDTYYSGINRNVKSFFGIS